jgi:hypothetical protein
VANQVEECPCGFWRCDYAKKLGWCEADGGDTIRRPVGHLCSRELGLEIKHWKEHKAYSREPWAISRVKVLETELTKRKMAGEDLDSYHPPRGVRC